MADHDADAFELLGDALVRRNDVVEGFRDAAGETAVMGRQAHREIPAPHRLERLEQVRQIDESRR